MARKMVAPWAKPVPAPNGKGMARMTADELLALGDSSRGYELMEGVLLRMSPTGGDHGDIAAELGMVLRHWVKAHGLGTVLAAETGFLVSQPGDPDTVLAPDAAFVRAERVPTKDSPERARFWCVAPDLVVEGASPSEHHPELDAKARAWLAAGTRLVWIVWPQSQQVDVWRPGDQSPAVTFTDDDSLDGADVLPGFVHPIAEIFA